MPSCTHNPAWPAPAAPQRRAFTLVELLIVISIIAVLLAILFPVLGKVQSAAKKTATETLIRDVRTSIETFRTDRGRLPGYFGATAMGKSSNEMRGFTTAENMILELSGGVFEGANPSDGTDVMTGVGPGSSSGEQVDVDLGVIGASDGPGYLTLKQDILRPIEGQVSATDEYEAGLLVRGMPDIVDPFGQPIMIWRQAAAVPKAITKVEQFALINPGNDPTDPERASFYWASNAGYLRAGEDGVGPGPQGLGEDRIDQHALSSLGSDVEREARRRNMAAILGSPAFPGELNPTLPSRPRGDVVIISAGADQLYFRRASRTVETILGYGPDARAPTDDVTDATFGETPDSFDDLIEATGG